MASRYKGSEDHSTKPIHFFKIILDRSLQEGKLRIPTVFVKKYAEGLSESAILKLPNGEEWKVNLTKHDGDVWLENGWKEFANYYSLAHGHLLVFRYEIPSCFQVIIFNTSALEINYPFQGVEDKEESNDVEECRPYQKRKDNASVEFPLPCKMRRIHEGDEYKSFSNLQTEPLHCKRKKCKEGSQGLPTSKLPKFEVPRTLQLPVTASKSNIALERANAFKSNNPFFVVVMRQSYIHSTANLSLPSHFAKQYFDLSKKRGNVILKVSNGRVWHLKYLARNIGTKIRTELSSGWRAFRNGNNLKEHDICIFELIGRNEITFRVFIFQHSYDPECPSFQGELRQQIRAEKRCIGSNTKFQKKALQNTSKDCKGLSTSKILKCKMTTRLQLPLNPTGRNTALDRANAFKSHNPFFLVVLRQSYIDSGVNLYIPSQFAKRYFDWDKMEGNIILRVLNGSAWPARYNIRINRGRSISKLSSGWREFAKGNNLDVDDVCLFELIGRTELTFQVSIFRESDCPNSALTPETAQKWITSQEEKKKMETNTKIAFCGNMESKTSQPHNQLNDGLGLYVVNTTVVDCWPSIDMCVSNLCWSHANRWQAAATTAVVIGVNLEAVGILRQVEKMPVDVLFMLFVDETGKLKQLTPGGKRTIHQNSKSSSVSGFRPHEVAGEFGSVFPFFRVKIKANHIKKWCMIIPRGFVKDYIKPVTQIVTLKVESRSWRVKLLCYAKTSTAFFSAGWREFMRENALEVGDICFFELLNNDDFMIKVSILKHSSVLS